MGRQGWALPGISYRQFTRFGCQLQSGENFLALRLLCVFVCWQIMLCLRGWLLGNLTGAQGGEELGLGTAWRWCESLNCHPAPTRTFSLQSLRGDTCCRGKWVFAEHSISAKRISGYVVNSENIYHVCYIDFPATNIPDNNLQLLSAFSMVNK